jgi:FHS family glucose/mannose:H+ symporter-like MFS transporter
VNRSLTYLGYLGYLLIGTASVLIPSVMPRISDDYVTAGLSLTAIGLIFPALAVGGMFGNIFSGIASDLLGRTRLVWMAALLLAGALAFAAAAHPWLLFISGFIVISMAQGALSTGINAMIADANREARSRALNLLHGIYGAGAAVSPLIIGFLLARGLPWRLALAGTGVLWLVYALGAYRLYRTNGEPREVAPAKRLDLGMLRDRPFLALFLIGFAYNGIAYSLLGWIALFMQESAGLSLFLSISVVSIFYVALTLGRFICAAYSERLGYARTLLILACGIVLTYPLVVLTMQPLVIAAGVFGTGLSLSGLFPTAMAYGSRLYPAQTGTLSGTLNVGMTLGVMIPPLWTGFLADRWGFQPALAINYLLALALLFLALYLRRVERDQIQPTLSMGEENAIPTNS